MPEPEQQFDIGEIPAVFLHEVDRAFGDLRETIDLVGHVLELYEGLPDDIGPMPPSRCGNLWWVLDREKKRFQEALQGWYRDRRAALGIRTPGVRSCRVNGPPVGWARWDTPQDILEALRCRIAPLCAWAERAHADPDLERRRVAMGLLELEQDLEDAASRVRELAG